MQNSRQSSLKTPASNKSLSNTTSVQSHEICEELTPVGPVRPSGTKVKLLLRVAARSECSVEC